MRISRLLPLITALGCAAPTQPATVAPTADASTCEVIIETRVEGASAHRELAVYARAATSPATLTLPDRCPQGPVAFDGLPETFDVYQTCTAGACIERSEPLTVTVAAGEQRELVRIPLDRTGASPCGAPLEPGHYAVSAVAPQSSERVCVVAVGFDVAPPAAPVVRVQRPPTPPPYDCIDSNDCVLFCPQSPGCCGDPCGCRTAVNKKYVSQLTADHARGCQRPPNCLAMGCDYRPAHGAACVEGRCVPGMH